ncbi:hypothetical protein [Mesorhizobium sp. IMUNJ 23232]|uniref:hypothetical protein n=1 Tax=Mesorhizobium sp. IMUNJ 23232 TaxID=3376064 RepID=UPI003798F28A
MNALVVNKTGLAEDSTDRIIYFLGTGQLFYDADWCDSRRALCDSLGKPQRQRLRLQDFLKRILPCAGGAVPCSIATQKSPPSEDDGQVWVRRGRVGSGESGRDHDQQLLGGKVPPPSSEPH